MHRVNRHYLFCTSSCNCSVRQQLLHKFPAEIPLVATTPEQYFLNNRIDWPALPKLEMRVLHLLLRSILGSYCRARRHNSLQYNPNLHRYLRLVRHR